MLVRPTIYHPLEGVIMVHHFTEWMNSVLSAHRILSPPLSQWRSHNFCHTCSSSLPSLMCYTNRAVLTGRPLVLWETLAFSTDAVPPTIAQLLVFCHTGSCFRAAAAVTTCPARITAAHSTLAYPIASAYSILVVWTVKVCALTELSAYLFWIFPLVAVTHARHTHTPAAAHRGARAWATEVFIFWLKRNYVSLTKVSNIRLMAHTTPTHERPVAAAGGTVFLSVFSATTLTLQSYLQRHTLCKASGCDLDRPGRSAVLVWDVTLTGTLCSFHSYLHE